MNDVRLLMPYDRKRKIVLQAFINIFEKYNIELDLKLLEASSTDSRHDFTVKNLNSPQLIL